MEREILAIIIRLGSATEHHIDECLMRDFQLAATRKEIDACLIKLLEINMIEPEVDDLKQMTSLRVTAAGRELFYKLFVASERMYLPLPPQ